MSPILSSPYRRLRIAGYRALRFEAVIAPRRVGNRAPKIAKGVESLAQMPGKDELRAKLLATLMAPAQNLVATLAAGPMNFMYLINARKEQLEKQG